jgi:hypothetical protein
MEMNLILLVRYCVHIREGCTVAGGVMKAEIARIAVFLRATLDRVAKVIAQVWCTWRFVQDSFKMAEYSPEFVRYCVEYLYSPVMMGLELFLAV